MMPAKRKFRGVVVPMITPMTADGALDESAAGRVVASLARHELGVFVLGTTGEAASVPASCRRRLVEIAVSGAGGRVPVFAGIGGNCAADSIAAAAEALQRQLDALARVFQRDRTLGQSLAALKAMMEIRGLCGPAMLPPLRAFDAAERKIVRRELAAHDREYSRPTAVTS